MKHFIKDKDNDKLFSRICALYDENKKGDKNEDNIR